MNIIFIGAPGSGKGTQSRKFIEQRGYVQLSTGDILRNAIKTKTETGLLAQSFMDQGKLVPDDVIIKLVQDFMNQNKGKSVIFDGFPRTVAQAESLKTMLASQGQKIDKVINFKINPQILVNRLTGRRTCSSCGEIYHIETKPSAKGNNCEKCGSALVHRPDDREEVISERLSQFEKSTAPTIQHYVQQGSFVDVDSNLDADILFKEILKVLDLSN